MIRLRAEWTEWSEDEESPHFHSHEVADWWLNYLSDPENLGDFYERLGKWGAECEWDEVDDSRTLVFEREGDATAFLLRWA